MEYPERGGFGIGEFENMFGSKQEYEDGEWNIVKGYARAPKENIPELFIGCGVRDIAVDSQVKEFKKNLDDAGVPYKYWETPGNHDFDTWEKMLDPVFSFLAGIPEGSRNSMAIPDFTGEE